jgi:ribosome-associated protein
MSRKITEIVQASLDDDKAEDPVVIDLDGKSTMADALIIASGRSARQVGAMADHLLLKLKAAGLDGIRIEGRTHADWVLIDAGDVIVHLFRPEVRAFYNLEKMWDAELPLSAERRAAGLHTA